MRCRLERVGVCRDFAHLAVTDCRRLNTPARYVNGYRRAGRRCNEFSAWIEVFLDGAWRTFYPRNTP